MNDWVKGSAILFVWAITIGSIAMLPALLLSLRLADVPPPYYATGLAAVFWRLDFVSPQLIALSVLAFLASFALLIVGVWKRKP